MKSIGQREEFSSIAHFHDTLVPIYKSAVYRPLLVTIQDWDYRIGDRVGMINPKRADKRFASYVDMKEVERVVAKLQTKDGASIRFGVKKEGAGYHGERGDFCLVGGYIEQRDLYLFWRSLELIGGFGYDLSLITSLTRHVGLFPRRVHLHAMTANVFALRGNSNEKLFPKLKAAIHG